LRTLASIGVFGETKAEEKEGEKQEQQVNQTRIRRFELTPKASLLQSEAKDSIRNFALLFGLEPFKKAIDNLLYSIQTGENSFKHANGLEIYEYFEQNQKEAQIFNSAMTSLTSLHASLISSRYDFSQFNTIIDIGGGQGMFLLTILKIIPIFMVYYLIYLMQLKVPRKYMLKNLQTQRIIIETTYMIFFLVPN
jgi:O-methyltransferase domain